MLFDSDEVARTDRQRYKTVNQHSAVHQSMDDSRGSSSIRDSVRSLTISLASSVCSCLTNFLGVRWELRGREHLEQDRACIIVSNHQSSLDIMGLFQIWPVMVKCTVIAKKELFYAWPFGLAAWLCGLIFIDRMNSEKARMVMNTATSHIKDNKIKLWIFPEGTRYNTGEIHPFKKGAFHVAISSQLPILPVVFSSYYFLSSKEKRFDSGRVIITTLPPISTEGLSTDHIEHLIQKTQSAMTDVFQTTSREVQLSNTSYNEAVAS
ncbi:1-Acylglycerol-3-phosphate O-acyltransferase 1 isoform X2 [Megalopta genalis]|uniref:1-Acylglycerol-3-phosphate O-acyltransferase 1 isoform X2 n=1 Tax=Megalopta genalis TaxID=115081 RepID=UPI0014432B61|nr:1-acyl-sn-glycerol-3-phosphate acyltransferase alpha isoform X2 [Megalopta genalis]